jgi:hypothetical protein
MVDRLCQEYQVAPNELIPDVASQLETWRRENLIESAHTVPVDSSSLVPTALEYPSLARCGWTIAWLRWLLRTRGFEAAIGRLRSAFQRVPATEDADSRAVRHCERSVAMAAALFPGRARCLEQSLALYYICRRQGAAVRYCQGVRLYPFEAHAWIEYRGEVMNDLTEHARLFARFPDQLP